VVGNNVLSGRDLYNSFIRNVDTLQQLIKSYLQSYLEENVLIAEKGVEFNALDWWKANTLKNRILSKLVRDILLIPITTVSSESTFSASGRVVDPHRFKLSTETVQMLLCGANWVRALHGFKKEAQCKFYFGVVVIVFVFCIYKVLNIFYFLFFNLRRRKRRKRRRPYQQYRSSLLLFVFFFPV